MLVLIVADCTNKGCYGTKIVASPATVAADKTTAVSVSATVPNLACGVVYHYRTRAVNAGGDQVGADKVINAICPAGATTNNATGLGTTTATLNGVLTSTNSVAATVTPTFELTQTSPVSGGVASPSVNQYQLYVVTPTTPSTSPDGTSSVNIVANLGAATNPATITPSLTLTCGKAYYYRLKLVNSGAAVHGGGTTYGAEKSFRTTPCTHTAITAAPTITSATEATLKGVVNPTGLTGGINVFFDIGLASNPAGTYTNAAGTALTDSTINIAATLPAAGSTGTVDLPASVASPTLVTKTTYRYRVKATHAAATSTGTVYGADVIFTTP